MESVEKGKKFSDKIKSEIFVRDKALCAFNCGSLWLLDYGAMPTAQYDWVDHIKPKCEGGNNSIENGILANFYDNRKKGNKTSESKYLLKNGIPTTYYYSIYKTVPEELTDDIRRFSKLHFSDYYFNRALYYIHLALEYLLEPEKMNGEPIKRNEKYWANPTEKKLTEWTKIVKKSKIGSFENRELISYNSEEVELILKLRNHFSIENILRIINELYPYYKKNNEIREKLKNAETIADIQEIEQLINKSSISPKVKREIMYDINKLKDNKVNGYLGRLI